MAVPWGLIVFLAGILYGWLAKGKQSKMVIFKKGLIYGFVAAIVLALAGWLFDVSAIGFGSGFVGFMMSVLILTIVFIVGVWLGDIFERATKKSS